MGFGAVYFQRAWYFHVRADEGIEDSHLFTIVSHDVPNQNEQECDDNPLPVPQPISSQLGWILQVFGFKISVSFGSVFY
jgi:hypothetical protein